MQLASQMQKDGPELADCSRQSDFENSDLKAANRYKFDCKPCDAIDNQTNVYANCELGGSEDETKDIQSIRFEDPNS